MANKKSPYPRRRPGASARVCGMPISNATAEACVACFKKANEGPVVVWENCFEGSLGRASSPRAVPPTGEIRQGTDRVGLSDFGLQEGFWAKGSQIIDPFGGVACGGIVCSSRGIGWTGVELEPHFHGWGKRTSPWWRGSVSSSATRCHDCCWAIPGGWSRGPRRWVR